MKNTLIIVMLILLAISCGENLSSEEKKKQTITDSILQIRIDSAMAVYYYEDSLNSILRNKYIGFHYKYPESFDFIEKYGNPETLEGTNMNRIWVAYFPKGNFTVVNDKNSQIFINIKRGRHPHLE